MALGWWPLGPIIADMSQIHVTSGTLSLNPPFENPDVTWGWAATEPYLRLQRAAPLPVAHVRGAGLAVYWAVLADLIHVGLMSRPVVAAAIKPGTCTQGTASAPYRSLSRNGLAHSHVRDWPQQHCHWALARRGASATEGPR